jgi:hypothetical protein
LINPLDGNWSSAVEDHVHRIGIAGHFLLIAASEPLAARPERSFSTSASVSLAPSMRVDDPTLSMVAIRRRLVSFSGVSVSMTVQRPLNSSISAISLRIPVVIVMSLIL